MGLLFKLKQGDTALKSLRYGNDRPGGGGSGQPFIKTPIPEDSKAPRPFDLDGFIRGGLDAPKAAQTDAERLSNYLFNFKNPSGLLFIAKQNVLSRVAPKTESSFGAAYGGGGSGGKTIDASDVGGGTGIIRKDTTRPGGFNEGIYTPLSTIGQARVGYLGTHLNKQGLDPTGVFPAASINKYQEVAFDNNKTINNDYQPGVPLNLYRKYQRTQGRQNRAAVRAAKAKNKYLEQKNKLTKQFKDPTEVQFGKKIKTAKEEGNLLSQVEYGTNNILKTSTAALNNFLVRWDLFLDKQAEKKSKKADQKNDILGDKVNALEDQMETAQMGRPRYDNRLLSLWDTKGLNESGIVSITSDPNIISYGGGPGSALGIGSTNIKFATLNDGITPARTGVNRTDPYKITGYKNYRLSNENGGIVYNSANIYGKGAGEAYLQSLYNGIFSDKEYTDADLWGPDWFENISKDENVSEGNLQPWVNSKPNTPTQDSINEELYKSFYKQADEESKFLHPAYAKTRTEEDKIKPGRFPLVRHEVRVNTGDPGKKPGNYNEILDKINGSNVNSELDPFDDLNDFVQFRIKTGGGNMKFRAFIDSMSDQYSSKWNSINYMGVGETFRKYNGFDRSISLSFTVVAMSQAEMFGMYDKLKTLASSVAPKYSSAGYMTGNISYLTIGGYIKNQPGIIESFTYDIPTEASWELIIGKGAEVKDELPMMIKVTGFKFTPIYKFKAQSGEKFITNAIPDNPPSPEQENEETKNTLNEEGGGGIAEIGESLSKEAYERLIAANNI